MKLTSERLRSIESVIKIRALCLRSGLTYTTIKSKLDQGRELTDEEAAKLTEGLKPLRYKSTGGNV